LPYGQQLTTNTFDKVLNILFILLRFSLWVTTDPSCRCRRFNKVFRSASTLVYAD